MALTDVGVQKDVLTSVQTSGLTQDILDALGAPIPAEHIKVLPGGSIRYTSDKWVFSRLDAVLGVGGWSDHYVVTHYPKPVIITNKEGKVLHTFVGTVACGLTVRGVTKSGVADMEVEVGMYGTPATNAQATSIKRAAMKFGVARELWTTVSTDRPSYQSSGSSKSSSNGATSGFASANQIKFITEAFGVPKALAAKLTGGRGGQASALIDALREFKNNDEDDYEEDAVPYIRKALKGYKDDNGDKVPGIAPSLAAMLDEATDDDSDED